MSPAGRAVAAWRLRRARVAASYLFLANCTALDTQKHQETVGELHKKACEIYGLTTEQTCIWDYFGHRKHALMNYLDKSLEDVNIQMNQDVCNLAWNKNVNELVSTHGYSQNQIMVWKYPSMAKVATLTGHSLRVLYLATSPDGQTIVTGAGDETLRFWNVFPSMKTQASEKSITLLVPS